MKKFMALTATLVFGWFAGLYSMIWLSEMVADDPEMGKETIYDDDNIMVTGLTKRCKGSALATVKFKN